MDKVWFSEAVLHVTGTKTCCPCRWSHCFISPWGRFLWQSECEQPSAQESFSQTLHRFRITQYALWNRSVVGLWTIWSCYIEATGCVELSMAPPGGHGRDPMRKICLKKDFLFSLLPAWRLTSREVFCFFAVPTTINIMILYQPEMSWLPFYSQWSILNL